MLRIKILLHNSINYKTIQHFSEKNLTERMFLSIMFCIINEIKD